MTPLVRAESLVRTYGSGGRGLTALRGVSLQIDAGEMLGVVGESGCGKSTLARCLLGLEPLQGGRVLLDGRELAELSRRQIGRQLQLIFQDPSSSLDPRLRVGALVSEPLIIHRLHPGRSQRAQRVAALLKQVGLTPELVERYPHQLSGGQRQRVAVARALAAEPRLIVADEPVSALDLSMQAQVLNLLAELQRGTQLGFLLIAHDLRVVLTLCQRVAVMYLGRIVEVGPAELLASGPVHPYTLALVSAALGYAGTAESTDRGRLSGVLRGELPSPLAPPPGCAFHPRCELYAAHPEAACTVRTPELELVAPARWVACHQAARGALVACSTCRGLIASSSDGSSATSPRGSTSRSS